MLGAIASLFGGGSGSAPTAVAAATGGRIIGPGTGTSDSIPAWLSNGEFVVNAAATSKNLALLQAINDNRMPAFAAGGPVGAMRSSGDAGGGFGGGLQVNIIGAPSEPTAVRQGQDANGQRRLDVVFDEAAASAVSRAGSRTSQALGQRGLMTG